jgi:lysozyme
MKDEIVLDEVAVKVALKLIKRPGIEGCELRAYPDPASPLYKELVKYDLLRKFLKGQFDIPDYMLKEYDGKPFTCGWGETEGVKYGDVWTQEYADERLEKRIREFMKGVLKACPQLKHEPYTKVAACTSLAYNIGIGAFAKSTVCKKTQAKDYKGAGEAFLMWVKAAGKVMQGLVNRRKIEKELYLSTVL